MLPPSDIDNRLLWVLRAYAYGKEFARGSGWLCDVLGVTRRDLQYARKRLEREHPVLSDHYGYWLSDNPCEYAAVIAHAIKNLRAEKARIDDLEACLTHTWPEYQPRLFDMEAA